MKQMKKFTSSLFGRRKILKDMATVEAELRTESRAFARMMKSCDNRIERDFWYMRSVERNDFADRLNALADMYKIL